MNIKVILMLLLSKSSEISICNNTRITEKISITLCMRFAAERNILKMHKTEINLRKFMKNV